MTEALFRLGSFGDPRPALSAADGQRRARSRRVAIDVVGFLDVAGILTGALAPAIIYGTFGELEVRWLALLQAGLVTCLFAYLCMRHFGLYETRRIHDLPIGPARVAAAIALSLTAALGLNIPFGIAETHFWIWYATWGAVGLVLVLAGRFGARALLSQMTASGTFDTSVAVYGNGTIARRLATHLADPRVGLRFAGVFDDRSDGVRIHDAVEPCAGTLDQLIAIGRGGSIDQIIIALPQSADRRTADVARRLEQLPVSLHVCTHIVSDLVDQAPGYTVSAIGPVGLLDIKAKPLADWGRHLKAVEDYVLASVAIACALPVMAVIALAIKIDSPGPVLFRQRRHGLNRRVIEVLKFRSMGVQEDGRDVRQASRGDPRVTRLGRFLRASSLDELPQLVNVLRGEMSLVGPRPHALVHDDQYGEMLERYANRQRVKPGMTGLAQVKGLRGPTETTDKMRARVEHDLDYIDNWSLWLDLRILGLTVLRGFRNKNAL